MPSLREKLDALPTLPPALPPDISPPLLKARTEHQPLGLGEERGGVQLQLPELAKQRCVVTAGAEGAQGQAGTVLYTLANLKQASRLHAMSYNVCTAEEPLLPSPTCRPCCQQTRSCDCIFS